MSISTNEHLEITIDEASPIMAQLSSDYNSPETVNDACTRNGWLALMSYCDKAYGDHSTEPVEQGIRDLVCDLRHVCNHLNLNFNELLERSDDTFQASLINPLG